jgi:predicted nucleic acid-binding protein
MATLVDSSVILDIVLNDASWLTWSRNALTERRRAGPLFFNPIVMAEVLAFTGDIGSRLSLLEATFERRDFPWQAAPLAGRAQAEYRRRGGTRDAILPDFLIGAHAAAEGLVLLTHDPRRVRTAFANLQVLSPDRA